MELLPRVKVAIVHDWLVNGGGAERHILEVCKLFPKAPVFTSVYLPEETLPDFKKLDVRPSYIAKIPFFGQRHQWNVGLRYFAWRRLNLRGYDVVISSSGSEAKAVKTRADQLHINICYSPTHYYWTHYHQYLAEPGFGWADPLVHLALRLLIRPLRWLDLWAAKQPDLMIANSNAVADRIKKYYKRSSEVVFPPVSVPKRRPSTSTRSGYVIVGRQVEYKNFSLAIEACNQLGRDLVVIGDGPQHNHLKSIAGPTIKIVGKVSEADKFDHLASALGFIFPNEDDFGIAPVEAMASGTPVVALAAGGALDTVIDGQTGVLFPEPTIASLKQAIQRFEGLDFSDKACKQQAAKFSPQVFQRRFKGCLDKAWEDHSGR